MFTTVALTQWLLNGIPKLSTVCWPKNKALAGYLAIFRRGRRRKLSKRSHPLLQLTYTQIPMMVCFENTLDRFERQCVQIN